MKGYKKMELPITIGSTSCKTPFSTPNNTIGYSDFNIAKDKDWRHFSEVIQPT